MESPMLEKAKKYADLDYTVTVEPDETTKGNPIFVARIVELEGCMSQGSTREEARQNVRAAALDYIACLLEDGLPIPVPNQPVTTSTETTTRSAGTVYSENRIEYKAEEDDQHQVYEVAFEYAAG
jgi:predicted RNase H-like HicB family nuclease